MLLLLVVVTVIVTAVNGFTITTNNRVIRSSTLLMMEKKITAAASLVKKGKLKSVNSLKQEIEEAGDNHYIRKFLSTGERPAGVDKPIDYYSQIKNNVGTVSVLVEYNRKARTGFLLGMPPPEIMGGVIRDTGAKALVASMDSRSGGVTPDDFRRFTIEQGKARLFLPGPLPIVWNDLVVDEIQITQAASLGAAAITIQSELVDDLSKVLKYCEKVGVEPIVFIKNVEEGEEAVAAGVRCICMHTLEESELVSLRSKLPTTSISTSKSSAMMTSDEATQNIAYCAKLRPEEDFSMYAEIDASWILRDSGFTAVWPSCESVYSTGMTDLYSTVLAMRSKASRLFFSPRQFLMDRKKEGAKEYLGDILY